MHSRHENESSAQHDPSTNAQHGSSATAKPHHSDAQHGSSASAQHGAHYPADWPMDEDAPLGWGADVTIPYKLSHEAGRALDEIDVLGMVP